MLVTATYCNFLTFYILPFKVIFQFLLHQKRPVDFNMCNKCSCRIISYLPQIRYDTKEEFNVDSKAEWSA